MPTVDVGVLTVIAPELGAARAALGLGNQHKEKTDDGTAYWRGTVDSEVLGRPLQVVLTCIASAGNPTSAGATTRLLERYRPRAVILMGIAAGIRGKVRIGDVVLSERVVAYEPAALVRDAHGRARQRRPDIDGLPHEMLQDVTAYLSEPPPHERLMAVFQSIGGVIPTAPRRQKTEYREHVIRRVAAPNLSTIASGEKLLRNPEFLGEVRRDIHGKVEAGEMEAAGFIEACRPGHVPWLIIRGISDFGDELKSDAFHDLASRCAATVLVDYLQHGFALNLPDALYGDGELFAAPPLPVDDAQMSDRTHLAGAAGGRTELMSFGENIIAEVGQINIDRSDWIVEIIRITRGQWPALKSLFYNTSSTLPTLVCSTEIGRAEFAIRISLSEQTVRVTIQRGRTQQRQSVETLGRRLALGPVGDIKSPLEYVEGKHAIWSVVFGNLAISQGEDCWDLKRGVRWQDIYWEAKDAGDIICTESHR